MKVKFTPSSINKYSIFLIQIHGLIFISRINTRINSIILLNFFLFVILTDIDLNNETKRMRGKKFKSYYSHVFSKIEFRSYEKGPVFFHRYFTFRICIKLYPTFVHFVDSLSVRHKLQLNDIRIINRQLSAFR